MDPPNYSFTLEQLKPFFPGNSLASVQQRLGPGQVIGRRGELRTLRFEITHNRFRFPVLVQVHEENITDLLALLPSYFLHDLFHQSLINRYGKQDRYLLKEEHAHYLWRNRDGLKHSYAGACTITCFPLYYSVSRATSPQGPPRYKTILQTIQIQEED